MLVSICIITYQRPEGLKRLLDALDKLDFSRMQCPDVEIVLIDNDPTNSAKNLVDDLLSSGFRWNIRFEIEATRGISYARNRSINCADENSEFLALIDDDEVPHRNWLEELLLVQKKYNADVVYGRVMPHFQKDVPDWVKKSNFFEPPCYKTGDTIEFAYTNNVLVRASLIKQSEKIFDERFALTGGEDSYFFRTLRHRGYTIVWADDAVVYEWIPSTRTTMKWMLLRAYRGCLTYTVWEQEVKASYIVNATSYIKAIAQMTIGIAMLFPSLLLEKHILMDSLLKIFRGAGKLSAAFGIRYEEYKVTHGA